MANGRVKTEMTGTGGGRWGPRAAIKDIANKQRRANDKVETEHEPVEQLAAERRLRLAELWEAAPRQMLSDEEVALDSPPFTPPELTDLAARGFVRRNRSWRAGGSVGLGHPEDEAQKLADDDVEDLQQPETD